MTTNEQIREITIEIGAEEAIKEMAQNFFFLEKEDALAVAEDLIAESFGLIIG